MAQDIVSGLFGLSPYQVQQQRYSQDQDYAAKLASMNGIQQAKYGIAQGAAGIGRGIGGMMGMVDPLVEQAKMREQVMGLGGDLSTSKGLKEKAAQFAQAGDQQTAMKLIMLARQQEAAEAKAAEDRSQAKLREAQAARASDPFAQINPKDYTPASIKAYMTSKNPADLVAVEKESADPMSYREWVLAGKPKTYAEWLTDQKKAGAPGAVTVKLPEQEKKFEGALGEAQAKSLMEGRAAADDALQMLTTNKVGRQILDKGMVTGFGANAIVTIGQALKQAGIDFGGDATANSQAYASVMAQNVGKLIKQFGAGTGLSDADREYATKMAGGLITVDEKAIRKVLDINDKAAMNVIKLHNKRASGVKTNIPLTVEPPEVAPNDLVAAAKAELERRKGKR